MSAKTEGIAPNASRLLWAGFMAILAAGVGFAIRNGILDNWGAEYGFTATQLGAISGRKITGRGRRTSWTGSGPGSRTEPVRRRGRQSFRAPSGRPRERHRHAHG